MADFLNVKTINSDDDLEIFDEDEFIEENEKVGSSFFNFFHLYTIQEKFISFERHFCCQ